MRELENHIPQQTEIHAVKPDKREKPITTGKPEPGQKCWQLNLKTGIITEAEFEQVDAQLVQTEDLNTGKPVGNDVAVRKKLIKQEGCIYCFAVTPETADKRFMKMLGKTIKKKDKLKRL